MVLGVGSEPAWLTAPEAQAVYLDMFLPEHLALGEAGYCCTLFRSAVASICLLDHEHSAAAAADNATALEDWEPRAAESRPDGQQRDSEGWGRLSLDMMERTTELALTIAQDLARKADNLGLQEV